MAKRNHVPRKIIVPLAFGAPDTLPQNKAIAQHALELRKDDSIPIFAQLDVALIGVNIFPIYKTALDTHITTLEIAEIIKNVCLDENWIQRYDNITLLPIVELVAAPQHLKRATRDFKKMGFDVTINKRTEKFLAEHPESFWYNWDSTQLWTKHPCFWRPREFVLRCLPWPVYKFITG